jgi:hypothetical protein
MSWYCSSYECWSFCLRIFCPCIPFRPKLLFGKGCLTSGLINSRQTDYNRLALSMIARAPNSSS